MLCRNVKTVGSQIAGKYSEFNVRNMGQSGNAKQLELGDYPAVVKKGDAKKCENYREIALLDVTYKIIAWKYLLKRDYSRYLKIQRENTRLVFEKEKSKEHEIRLHPVFIDFEKEFDITYVLAIKRFLMRFAQVSVKTTDSQHQSEQETKNISNASLYGPANVTSRQFSCVSFALMLTLCSFRFDASKTYWYSM